MRRIFVFCFVLPLVMTLVPVLFGQALHPATSSRVLPYLIQPGDMLNVNIWKEPEASGDVLVMPDGRISFPPIQDLQAAGLSTGQLQEKITERVKDVFKGPVTVVVKVPSYRVYVLGKVVRSGEIASTKPINVLQALTIAGGLLEIAKKSEITVIRGTGENAKYYLFNYDEALSGANRNTNIPLESGDIVAVK